MADIAEQICLAVDQIIGERLKSINFDTTITATIEDDKEAKNYKYICSNGTSQFVAFSKDTIYKKGDSVQVTIPNNDYSQQKIIIGKYVAKDATPFVFTQPFETIIDVSANIIKGNENTIQSSLIANDNYNASDEPFIVEQLLYSKYFSTGYKGYNRLGLKGQFRSWLQGLKPIKGNYGYRLEILSSSQETLKDSVITSWVKLYSDFLEGKNIPEKDAIFQATPEEWFVNLADTSINTRAEYINKFNLDTTTNSVKRQMLKDILNLKLKIDKIYLDSEEMYGNPYNFQSYFEQEKVYDITSIDTILGMNLYFYEISGSFINELGEPIPYLINVNEPSQGKKANLFTKDPYICLGYDLSGFDKEQAILYCLDGDTFLIKDNIPFEKNIKNINLRWLHEFENGDIKVINNINQLGKKDSPCEIRWYRFKMGVPSADQYSGVYWERDLDPTKDLDYINKQCESFNEFKTKVLTEETVEQMKTIVEDLLKKYPLYNEVFKKVTPAEKIGDTEVETYTLDIDKKNELIQEEITNKKLDISSFKYTLHPATNVASEQIKAIILYDGKIVSSNILTFTNEDSEGVSNAATAKTVAGLSIWCNDGSYGNYFVYGQNNQILENSKLNANTIQILQAKFADASLLASEYDIDKKAPDLTEAKQIIWEFPLRNSMLVVDGFKYDFTYSSDEYLESENGSPKVDYDKVRQKDKSDGGARYKLNGYFNDARIEVLEETNQIFIIREGVIDPNSDNLNYNITSQQKYKIKNFYSASNANNTVKCTVYKNNMQYSATKEFSFGLRGTTGTDATLVIDFDNNKTALTADLVSDELKLTAHLYDSTYNEIDFNDLSLGLECIWSWAVYNQNYKIDDDENIFDKYFEDEDPLRDYALQYLENFKQDTNSLEYKVYQMLSATDLAEERKKLDDNPEEKKYLEGLIYIIQKNYCQDYGQIKFEPSTDNQNVCRVFHDEVLDIDNLNYFQVLQVTVKNWGNYDLIAYKAIPIRRDQRYRNIIGPVDIVYGSNGTVDYNKIEYDLWGCADLENDIDKETDTVKDDIRLVSLNEDCVWNIHNVFNEKADLIGSFKESGNILRPAVMYTKDASPYGVKCVTRADESAEFNKILWIQPLVIMQNKYPSATLNAWDGKGIQMNDEEGFIVAPAIAAGKKNSDDNTFSGVMFGDWSKNDIENSIGSQTGVYGFHHGAQSFAFKEDGTAFIGKSGKGRIYFDGNSGTLESARWKASEEGMFIDLDDGILRMQKLTEYDIITLVESDYVKGTYYVFKTGYSQLDYKDANNNNAYDSSKTYYKKVLTDLGYLSLSSFQEKFKEDENDKTIGLYKKNTIHSVLEDEQYDGNTTYFKEKYTQIKVTKEEFDDENSHYYIEGTNEKGEQIFEDAKPPYNGETKYWKLDYTKIINQEEFEALKTAGKNIYTRSYNYSFVTSEDNYHISNEYAEYQYKAQTYPSTGVEDTWNTANDPALKDENAYKDKAGHYYLLQQTHVLSEEAFDPYETYYTKNSSNQKEKYITLSAAELTYPFSIGNQKNEASRNFKVEWDGTAHINNGRFKGTVTADYLECDSGYIGGWEIDYNSLSGGGIELNSREGSIKGGKLVSPAGGMLLDGFLSVADGNGNTIAGTYFGYMQSNTGNLDVDLATKGIGMRIEQAGGLRSQVKATTYNAGLSYVSSAQNGGYLSMSETGFSLGTKGDADDVSARIESPNVYLKSMSEISGTKVETQSALFLENSLARLESNGSLNLIIKKDNTTLENGKPKWNDPTTYGGMYFDKDSWQLKSNRIELLAIARGSEGIGQNWTSDNGKGLTLSASVQNGVTIYSLSCNIPAGQQTGIYARFAPDPTPSQGTGS